MMSHNIWVTKNAIELEDATILGKYPGLGLNGENFDVHVELRISYIIKITLSRKIIT